MAFWSIWFRPRQQIPWTKSIINSGSNWKWSLTNLEDRRSRQRLRFWVGFGSVLCRVHEVNGACYSISSTWHRTDPQPIQDRFSCPYGLVPVKISTQMTFLGWDYSPFLFLAYGRAKAYPTSWRSKYNEVWQRCQAYANEMLIPLIPVWRTSFPPLSHTISQNSLKDFIE